MTQIDADEGRWRRKFHEFFASFAGFARDDSEAGFRAKDAEDAKVLQPDFFKFIYKSLHVAFQELSAKIYQ